MKLCFTGVAGGHITHDEHDYKLGSSGGIVYLLGRTSPILFCAESGCFILNVVGFRICRGVAVKSMIDLHKAFHAFQSHKSDDEESFGRIAIEGCTEPGSLLSLKTPWSKGCKVIPNDNNDDWCSVDTLNKCRENLSGQRSALWFSSPCAGGTSWTHVNMHRRSSTVARIKGHWVEFRKLWKRLEDNICFAVPHGAAIFIQWPRGCKYWTNSNVARFLAKYGFKFIDFGFMYGFVAPHGKMRFADQDTVEGCLFDFQPRRSS